MHVQGAAEFCSCFKMYIFILMLQFVLIDHALAGKNKLPTTSPPSNVFTESVN